MVWPDVTTWNLWIWFLHVLAAFYLLGFFAAWFRFRRDHGQLEEGNLDKSGWNRRISGFPWSFYAKMLGRKRYDLAAAPGDDIEEGDA